MWKKLLQLVNYVRKRMGLLDNIDNIAFATSYNNDKILEVFPGSFTALASATSTTSIPHVWGASVFPVMIWSDDNTTWQDAGSATFAAASTTVELSASCSVDADDILVSVSNSTGSNKTCYYKIALIVED